MADLNRIEFRNVPVPSVELDPSCHAVYLRFRKAKVHKTVSDERPGAVVAVDLDARGEIIGCELVGITECTIRAIRRALPKPMQKIDFERARFVLASTRHPEATAA